MERCSVEQVMLASRAWPTLEGDALQDNTSTAEPGQYAYLSPRCGYRRTGHAAQTLPKHFGHCLVALSLGFWRLGAAD